MNNNSWCLLLGLLLVIGYCKADTKVWNCKYLSNDLIDLKLVPEIGGRVLQYKLGDYGFYYVNKDLYDKKPPASGLGPENSWLNYGGDKLWLAPQGWSNEKQWPGPPDPVLDGQPYKIEIINNKKVRLTSREDLRSGVKLSRTIEIFDGTTRVSIDATMKNIDTKTRRWGIWAHTQFYAGNRHGKGYNKNYWAYCPINENSIFQKGYGVQYGLVNNISYKPDYDKGIMKVHYQRRVGKIGLDSAAGWTATVDGTDGYVFIQRFTYKPEKTYPDNSSVEIWMDGLGEFVAWGEINRITNDDPSVTPYNFENELISPYATLKPSEEYSFHYDWYSAKIPARKEIVNCSNVGVICQPLDVIYKEEEMNITGKFGVFYEGTIKAVFLNQEEKVVKESFPGISVSPLESLNLSLKISRHKELSQAKAVSIVVCDKNKKALGELDRVSILSD
ncbi:DUF4380 domain-containing protein [Sedimentisphaera salicampi]|uniref:DUF4380 domain-containing protein n=1 Tax=Sedimentisphaera salicampi TaxID=1941349 RepID=A0A1W6LJQ8_9BACT|nr:DUF4380 domain-containing protein [Sedimentisphaera salicampi]ARN55986.1 hypothetical protein STSP1_00356 [Sedimentisphaera salicampi]